MKPKYKIGDLIKTKETEDTAYTVGVIEGVLVKNSGIEYLIEGENNHVSENDIATSYVERKPRAPRKVKGEGKTRTRREAKAA